MTGDIDDNDNSSEENDDYENNSVNPENSCKVLNSSSLGLNRSPPNRVLDNSIDVQITNFIVFLLYYVCLKCQHIEASHTANTMKVSYW